MSNQMLRLSLMLTAFLFSNCAVSQTPDMNSRSVLTSKQALLLMDPLLICQPTVIKYSVSSDGEGVLVERQVLVIDPHNFSAALNSKTPPKMERQIVLYNSSTRESKIVWRSASPSVYIQQMEWMKNGESALFVTVDHGLVPGTDPNVPSGPRHEMYRVTSVSQRALKTFETAGDNEFNININFSPFEPLAFLSVDKFEKKMYKAPDGTMKEGLTRIPHYQVIRQDGKPGMEVQIVEVPENTYLGWDAVGNPIFTSIQRNPNGKGAKLKYFQINPGNLTSKELTVSPTMYEPKELTSAFNSNWNVSLSSTTQRIPSPDNKQVPITTTWLISKEGTEKPNALVCSDSLNASFMGKDKGIIFQSMGGLWHMQVGEMTLAEYKELKSAADRQVAVSNAKQAGLALAMYAQDYDEKFPTGDDFNNKIFPYIKNQDILNSFTYTYGGGLLSAISNPTETELGYVNGPGGKAIVYADGHAKWKSN